MDILKNKFVFRIQLILLDRGRCLYTTVRQVWYYHSRLTKLLAIIEGSKIIFQASQALSITFYYGEFL